MPTLKWRPNPKIRFTSFVNDLPGILSSWQIDLMKFWNDPTYPCIIKLFASFLLTVLVLMPLIYPLSIFFLFCITLEYFVSGLLPENSKPIKSSPIIIMKYLNPRMSPYMEWKVKTTIATTIVFIQTSIPLTLRRLRFSNALETFPENFVFGVATAAHQIEGAWNISGKGENAWDHFTHTKPEMIADGTNGDVATDSYHRYQEDVDELSYLGVDFYRLSLSWARILPNGRIDNINEDGIRYYNALFDALEKENIKPYVTLYHWDLPQTIQDLGGWTNPIIIQYFRDYADLCFREFGDRVKSWITINEPYEVCEDAYGDVLKAPGLNSHGVGNYLCSDNLLKSHAAAYHLYNDTYRATQNGHVMISINSIWYQPADEDNPELVELAETANQFKFGWFAHPIFSKEGGYPQVMIDNVAKNSEEEGLKTSRLQQFDDYWREYIRGTSDYLGINHYTTWLITGRGVDPSAKSPSWLRDIGATQSMGIGTPTASSTWFMAYAPGLGNFLRWCKATYDNPEIYITENGFSDRGEIQDYDRIQFFNDYLSAVLEAIEDGVRVSGYTVWTLMDNFEWRAGFSERFGLWHVDITDPALPRTKKLSADYYKELIATRKLPQDQRFFRKSETINLENMS